MAKKNSRLQNILDDFPLHNLGVVFFAVIMIYVVICIFIYFTTEHISRYEVKVGSLTESNIYTGVAIRDEQIINSNYSGYVSYYSREGERAGFGDLVCLVDESGKLQEQITELAETGNSLSDNELKEVKSQIVNFNTYQKTNNFSDVYGFKYDIEGTVLKLANLNVLENLEKLNSSGDNGLINLCNAPDSGIVIYSVDGYEKLVPTSVSKDTFNLETYEKQSLLETALVGIGDPIYKLSDNENWSIVIQADEEQAKSLSEESYVEVKFLKNQLTSWAKINVLSTEEDVTFVELQLNNSMITFCTDRFLEIELIYDEETGLKVPNSAVDEKEFFLIESEFLIDEQSNDVKGVLLQTYTEEGQPTSEYIELSVYNEKDGYYYVDSTAIDLGDIIKKLDSMKTYTISKKEKLTGVYNMNKGYADFKQINVLSSNEEYSIVESNTNYGLRAYDYIVLDVSVLKEDEEIK